MHQKTYLDIIEESPGYTEIVFILYVPFVSTKESYKNIFVLDWWSNYKYQVYSQMILCVFCDYGPQSGLFRVSVLDGALLALKASAGNLHTGCVCFQNE